MKILHINKYFYLKGGAERCFFEWGNYLESKGHKVIPFSMKHVRNYRSTYDSFFSSQIDFNSQYGILNKFKIGLRSIYSIEARRNLSRLIKETKPDIAHIHSICYQLTSSVLFVLKEYKIPIIQTAHEYKHICPNQRLLNSYTQNKCEACKGGKYYMSVVNRCIKGSVSQSFVGFAEAYLNDFLKAREKCINTIITPSLFLKRKLIEFSINKTNITNIPNFIVTNDYVPSYSFSNYIVYFGHLSEMKGIRTLITAMSFIRKAKLLVVGEGELRNELEEIVSKTKLDNVDFIGYKQGDELKEIIRNSMFVVVPSEWYENFPYSVLESLALGKPVIGSSIGGIPEMIDDGVNGFLFRSGDVEDLTSKIKFLIDNKQLLPGMGRKARQKVENKFNVELHYKALMNIYDKALGQYN